MLAHIKIIEAPYCQGNTWVGKISTTGLLLLSLILLLSQEPLFAEDFDWRDIGGMNFETPVRYQDHTGMCWAFSSVADLESMYKITRNDPDYNPDLSEQQLASAGMGDAIIGGFPSNALAYFKSTGVVTEEELPFTKTNYSPLWPLAPGWQDRVYKINSQSGFTGNAATIKDKLKQYGPIITEMQIDTDWYGPEQGYNRGGHAVLITGFHDDPTLPGGGFFIVKNSWGTWWGDQGYGKILYSAFGTYSQWMINGPAYAVGAANILTWDISADPGFQSGNGTWSTNANNWSASGVGLGSWQNGEDAAVFTSSGASYGVNIDGTVIAHGITFQDGTGGYLLNGGALTVTHGGITANANAAINSDITVGAPQQWTLAGGKTLTIGGAVNAHISQLTVSGDGDTVIQGVIRDIRADPLYAGLLTAYSGSLLKSGGGTLTLTAANIYTGDTKVFGGTLALAGANGAIISSNIYITGGRILIDNSADNHSHRIGSSAGVTLQGGELALRGHSSGTSENVDKLTLDSNSSTITVAAEANTSILIAPSLNRNPGATALVRGTSLGNGASGPVGQICFTAAPMLSNSGSGDQIGIIPYLIGDNNINGGGSDLATYGDNGLRPLNGGEYSPSLQADRNVRLAGGQTSSTGMAIRSLVLDGNGAASQITINNGSTLTVTSGAILSIGSPANSISGGTITFGNNSATGYEGIVHAVGNMTIQSVIANNGGYPVGLTKGGAGVLTLVGNNTFAGRTYISGGKLQIGGGGITGSLAGPITDNAELVFNRSDTVTYSGQISGSGALTKIGGNTLIFTGYNSYTGGTTIAEGALQIGNGVSSGVLPGNVLNNSNLIFNLPGTSIFRGIISGSGSLSKLGSGTLSINAANTYSGSTIINNGRLKLLSAGSLESSLINVHSGIFDVSSVNGYTLDSGKIIEGSGLILGAVAVRGIMAPGDGLGALGAGDLTFGDGSMLDIELGGAAPGLYDVLNSTGALAFQPGSKLKISLLGDFSPDQGSIFDIINFSSLAGTFSALNLPVLDNGRFWDTSGLYLNGMISVVPEPGIAVMLLAISGAIVGRKVIHRRI